MAFLHACACVARIWNKVVCLLQLCVCFHNLPRMVLMMLCRALWQWLAVSSGLVDNGCLMILIMTIVAAKLELACQQAPVLCSGPLNIRDWPRFLGLIWHGIFVVLVCEHQQCLRLLAGFGSGCNNL